MSVRVKVTRDAGTGSNMVDISGPGGGAVTTGVNKTPGWGEDARDWIIYHLIERIAKLEDTRTQ